MTPLDGSTWPDTGPVPAEVAIVDADDPASITCTWGGEMSGTEPYFGDSLTGSVALAVGAYTLSIQCSDAVSEASDEVSFTVVEGDVDGDGSVAADLGGDDCDDESSEVHPGAVEVCDGVDNDCNDLVDDAPDAPLWYADADEDSFGDLEVSLQACETPAGYLEDATDCDDAAIAVNPAATELCNAVDDDCDGLVDNDAEDALIWYVDSDGDGYGWADTSASACEEPSGFVADDTDCDDAVARDLPRRR